MCCTATPLGCSDSIGPANDDVGVRATEHGHRHRRDPPRGPADPDPGELGITCNTLCPGYVEIPTRVRTQSSSAGKANTGRYSNPQQNHKDLTRTGRHATLDEVAHAAVSLLGEHSGAITGTTLNVDGGSSPY
ncbi:SDR family oxidoreductase [Gordonia amicalis]|uniref:SDR family oxidoreductase n=1 Tax=Gordonia amicalis TaxID=89053 RepID=UPI0037BF2C05